MSQQPTPEAVEAVARAIDAQRKSMVRWDTSSSDYRRLVRQQADAAIAAYLAHQRQHAPDTLAADLAAILEHPRGGAVDIRFGIGGGYSATVEYDDYQFYAGDGDTIPEAVAALRRQIEGAEG